MHLVFNRCLIIRPSNRRIQRSFTYAFYYFFRVVWGSRQNVKNTEVSPIRPTHTHAELPPRSTSSPEWYVPTGEPTLTHHRDPKSTAHIRVPVGVVPSLGTGHQSLTAPKVLCVPPIHLTPWTPGFSCLHSFVFSRPLHGRSFIGQPFQIGFSHFVIRT